MTTNQELRKLAEAADSFRPTKDDLENKDYMDCARVAHRAFAAATTPAKVIELLDRIDRLEAENEVLREDLMACNSRIKQLERGSIGR